jgi:hypothetical protein
MCVECMEQTEVATIEEPTTSPELPREVDIAIRLKGLQRHLADPESWPVCTRCEFVHPAGETHAMYNGQCLMCGLNRLEKLYYRLWKARTRKAERKALRALRRFARKG